MPLVVSSHGSGGVYNNYSWIMEALVAHGYAVAVFNHPFDTALDKTDAGVMRVRDRPQDINLHIVGQPALGSSYRRRAYQGIGDRFIFD